MVSAPTRGGPKPKLAKEPGAWLRRKLKLKLNDMIARLQLRVVDKVDFHAMSKATPFAHILDVGVADGTPDLYASFPDAYLDLFEPYAVHRAALEAGVLAQRPGRLHAVALGAAEGTASLHLTGRTGSSLLGSGWKPADAVEAVDVPVRRLDAVIAAEDIRSPCLLKIDTEGFELDVLRGATALLPAIHTVVAEVHFDKPHAYAPWQIADFLRPFGFRLVDMLDHHVRGGYVVCADFVFERIEGV
jgi:FkbM family methyltransferase